MRTTRIAAATLGSLLTGTNQLAASAITKEHDMAADTNVQFRFDVLKATGADNDQQAIRFLDDANSFLNSVRKATGAENFGDMLAKAKKSREEY